MNKKLKISLIVASIVIFVLLLTSGAYLYWRNNYAPIAVINDVEITEDMVEVRAAQDQKFYEYNQDTESLNNIDQITEEKLIEEAVITTEAAERGITVTEEEVQAEYKERMAAFASEEAMLNLMATTYDLSKDQLLANIRIQLLQEKLEAAVTNTYDVKDLYVRFDYTGNENDASVQQKSLAKLTAAREEVIAGATLEEALAKIEKDPTYQDNNSGVTVTKGISATTQDKLFASDADWAVISKTTKVGDITEIAKAAGYYAFYQITKAPGGEYATWDDFVASVVDSSQSELINKLLTLAPNNLRQTIAMVADFLVPTAYAVDTSCSIHKAGVGFQIFDRMTENYIKGATVSIAATTTGIQHTRDGVTFTYPSNCQKSSASGTTDSIGAIDFGDSADNGPGLDCVYPWNISITKTGYQTYSGSFSDLKNGDWVSRKYRLSPNYTLSVQKTGNATGIVISLSGGIDCGTKCANTYTASGAYDQTTLTATPTNPTIEKFTGWEDSRCAAFGTGSCTLTIDTNYTAIAKFDLKPVTSPTCGLTSPSTGTVYGAGTTQVTMTAWAAAPAGTTVHLRLLGASSGTLNPIPSGVEYATGVTNTTQSYTITGLTDGMSYAWACQAWDDASNVGTGGNWTWSIATPPPSGGGGTPPPPYVNCAVEPTSGTAPLTVRFSANTNTGWTPAFDTDVKEGEGFRKDLEQPNGVAYYLPLTLYHVYNLPGTYRPAAAAYGAPTDYCDEVVVSPAGTTGTKGKGNEVSR